MTSSCAFKAFLRELIVMMVFGMLQKACPKWRGVNYLTACKDFHHDIFSPTVLSLPFTQIAICRPDLQVSVARKSLLW